ncbi:uncharacterized protein [Diadema setosum]|uniref:uncharacterized protein n=1 Tax=Diadema setosum TaxID=31175 RepID=UPI003B3B80B5
MTAPAALGAPPNESCSASRFSELATAVSTLQSTVMSLLDTQAPPAPQEQPPRDDDIDMEIEELVQQDSGVLGEFSDMVEHQSEPVGAAVSGKLANIVNKLIRLKLKEPALKSKQESYPRPANCEAVATCRVNPEVWHVLKTETRVTDSKLQKVQTLFLTATTPLARAADELLSQNTTHSSRAAKLILDGIALIGAANVELNAKRRDFIRPELSPAFRPLCSEDIAQKPSTFLFGDDLPQKCKELRDTEKLGLSVRNTSLPKRSFRQAYRGAYPRRHPGHPGRYDPYPQRRNDGPSSSSFRPRQHPNFSGRRAPTYRGRPYRDNPRSDK